MAKNELTKNINRAKHKLNSILSKYSKSNDTKLNKKANLLSYWLVDYLKMIEREQSFDPHRLKKYKRGDILKANLGFNIGHEEGGLHYVVVVSNTNANSSDLLTVVPLTSLKTNSKITDYDINLGTTLYDKLTSKFDTEFTSLEKTIATYKKQSIHLKQEIKCLIENTDENSSEMMVNQKFMHITDKQNELFKKIDILQKDIITLQKVQDELEHMKSGSIALVGQLTTISKIRIYNPKNTHEALHGIKLSDSEMDLIDNKIIELYTKKAKN